MINQPKPRRKTGADALGGWPKHGGGDSKSRRRGNQANSAASRAKTVPMTLKKAPWEQEKQNEY